LSDTELLSLAILFAILLGSLTVHEAAHAWTADQLGDPTARLLGRVSLNPVVHADLIGTIIFPLVAIFTGVPLIGWAKPVPVDIRRLRNHRRDYVFVAAAGPASNLVLAVLAAVAYRLASPASLESTASLPAIVFERMVYLNVLLAVFNMIPVPPLDGGNVIGGLLPSRLAVSYDSIRPYGILVLYALMFTGTLYTLVEPPSDFLLSWLLPQPEFSAP
jgi:Zn-dependent protease